MVGFAGASFVRGAGVAAAVARLGLERASDAAFLGASIDRGSGLSAGFAAGLLLPLASGGRCDRVLRRLRGVTGRSEFASAEFASAEGVAPLVSSR